MPSFDPDPLKWLRGQYLRGGIAPAQGGSPVPLVADFTTGALPSGWTLGTSAAGVSRLRRTSNLAKWAQVAWGSPRFHFSTLGASLGLLLERSHVTKCLLGANPATAPVDTSGSFLTAPTNISRITSPGADVAGFEDVVTAALRADNSASGSAVVYQLRNTTGNTNKHTIQGLTRDVSGTGPAYGGVSLSGGGSVVGPPGPGFWEVAAQEDITPSTASRVAQITNRANRVLDIGWVLLTETKYAPTPYLIPTDNVAPTIASEFVSAPVSSISNWSTSELALAFEWYHEWPFSVDNEPIFAVADSLFPANSYCRIVGMADGSVKIDMAVGGVTVFSSTFAAPTRRTVCRAAIRLKSGSFLAALNGVGGTVDADVGSWADFDTIYLNRLGAAYSNVIARKVETLAAPLSDDQVVAASAPNSGGYV